MAPIEKASRSRKRAAPPTPPTTVTPGMHAMMEMMAKALSSVMKEAKAAPDEWELATKPMETRIDDKEKELSYTTYPKCEIYNLIDGT